MKLQTKSGTYFLITLLIFLGFSCNTNKPSSSQNTINEDSATFAFENPIYIPLQAGEEKPEEEPETSEEETDELEEWQDLLVEEIDEDETEEATEEFEEPIEEGDFEDTTEEFSEDSYAGDVLLEENVEIVPEDAELEVQYEMRLRRSPDLTFSSSDRAFGADELMEYKVESPKSKPTQTWKRSNLTANSLKLSIGDREDLTLKGVQMAVQIDGFRARVLMDCFFYNDRERNLEGTFKLRLPNGASPYFFAFGNTVYLDEEKQQIPFIEYPENLLTSLDNQSLIEMRNDQWSEPKGARIVPQEKAAFAYNETVRKRVDPALMEWAGADIFNCRVFPLQPKKLHRVVIGYDVNLIETEAGRSFTLSVPQDSIPRLINFDVAQLDGESLDILPQQKLRTSNKRVYFQVKNPKNQEFKVFYNNTQPILLTRPKDKVEPYFAASFQLDLPETPDSQSKADAVFLLDVSLSSNPDKFNIWLKMLESILKNNPKNIQNFAVGFFNVETFWWKNNFQKNTPQNIRQVLKYANQLALEGASDLGQAFSSISNTNWLKKRKSKNIFLLSDGSVTWGEDNTFKIIQKISKSDKVFAYNTGLSNTDFQILNQIARETGGAVFSIVGEDEIQKASKAFIQKPWKVLDIQMDGAQDILLAGRPGYIYAGQKTLASGRGVVDQSKKMILNLVQGNTQKTIEIEFVFEINSDLSKRSYGQMAIEQLDEFGYLTEAKAQAYSMHFQIPSKSCAFLMLETEAEYTEFEIEPRANAWVMKQNPAAQSIQDLLLAFKSQLNDPKADFMAWLNKLDALPGVKLNLTTDFQELLDDLPKSVFEINIKDLKSQNRLNSKLSDELKQAYGQDKLNYDLVVSKATDRKNKMSNVDGLKLLSSLIERNPNDGVMARDISFTAISWDLSDQAYFLLKRQSKIRPFEPQTYDALGEVLQKMNKIDLAMVYYEIALAGKWDPRFGEFKRIVSFNYLQLLKKVDQGAYKVKNKKYARKKLKELKKYFPDQADVVVLITWNTDFTDIDLHVKEPSGEECYYENPRTKAGGRLTKDVTQGYGPEMYVLQEAPAGKYKILINYYSSKNFSWSTRTKVYVIVYQNWGKANEKITKNVYTLNSDKLKKKTSVLTFQTE